MTDETRQIRRRIPAITLNPMAPGVQFIRDAKKLLAYHIGTAIPMACPPRAWALKRNGDAVAFASQPNAEA